MPLPRTRLSVGDWKAMVFRAPSLNNGVRVLLLYLADQMRGDLTVSVPRSRIAADLGVNVRRVTERVHAAHEAGFLDTVVSARPHVTAVYTATFPDPRGAQGCTSEANVWGAKKRTSKQGVRGADGGPPISKHVEPETLGLKSLRGQVEQTQQRETEDLASRLQDPGSATRQRGGETSTRQRGETSTRQRGETSMRQHGETQEGSTITLTRDAPINHSPSANTGTHAGVAGSLPVITRAQRRQLLDAIQRCTDGHVSDELHDLLAQFDEELAGDAANYWTFPKSVRTDRKEAGRQLNMLINTWNTKGSLAA